jgi:hypothetical protein
MLSLVVSLGFEAPTIALLNILHPIKRKMKWILLQSKRPIKTRPTINKSLVHLQVNTLYRVIIRRCTMLHLYRGTFHFYMAPRNQHTIQGDETATHNVTFVLWDISFLNVEEDLFHVTEGSEQSWRVFPSTCCGTCQQEKNFMLHELVKNALLNVVYQFSFSEFWYYASELEKLLNLSFPRNICV